MSQNEAPLHDPEIPVIVLRGKINHATIQPLVARLADHRSRGQVHQVLDMQPVDSLSCGALGALLLEQTHAEKCGGSIKIAAPSAAAHEALKAHGFTSVFEIHENRTKALASFGDDTQAA